MTTEIQKVESLLEQTQEIFEMLEKRRVCRRYGTILC